LINLSGTFFIHKSTAERVWLKIKQSLKGITSTTSLTLLFALRVSAFSLMAFLLFTPVVYAQAKLGYIDYEKVKVVFPEYNVGLEEMAMRSWGLQDSLMVLYANLQRVLRHFPEPLKTDTLSRNLLEHKLFDVQNQFVLLQEKGQKQLRTIQAKLDFGLKSKILKTLAQFSSENDLICLSDKKAILYCEDCRDLTDEFILYFKRKR
jgi:hypothetical protein